MTLSCLMRITAFAVLSFSFHLSQSSVENEHEVAARGIKSFANEFDRREDQRSGNFLANDGQQKVLGPYHESLGDERLHVNLTWHLYIEDPTDNTRNDIELELSVTGDVFNFLAIGFSRGLEFRDNDWFIVWKSRHGLFHYKDCNTMRGALHFDRNQDYEIVAPNKLHSFQFTLRRALDTGDKYDVQIKPGKTNFIWDTGIEESFSKIKTRMRKSNWKSQAIDFFREDFKAKPTQVESLLHSLKGTNVSPLKLESKTAALATNEVLNTKEGKVKDDNQHKLHDSSSSFEEIITRPSGQQKLDGAVTDFRKDNLPKVIPTVLTGKNCTIIVKKTKSWYEVVRLKEYSVYYAIIGSSAMITGIIVIMFACCCSITRPSSQKAKVAFYKVDDYEDEQIEFLRDKA